MNMQPTPPKTALELTAAMLLLSIDAAVRTRTERSTVSAAGCG
jgi:hypothetical protein